VDNGGCKEMYWYIEKNPSQNNVQNRTTGNGQLVGISGM
jgi:hypothetical protein